MKATIGRTVIVHGISSNGATEQPAIITRVWAPDRSTEDGPVGVNLTVFPDGGAPFQRGSVMLHHTEEQARAACHGNAHAIAAYWPPRA